MHAFLKLAIYLAHFWTVNYVTKKDEILKFVDPNVINSQHDMDMCVEKIEHFLNEEIGVFFKVKGGQPSQAPTSKPFSKIHCFCLTMTSLGLTKTLNGCIEIMF